jgi:hypothetical protein
VARFLEAAKADRLYDFRFESGIVSIVHSLEDIGSHLRVKGPKPRTRKRNILLSRHTLQVLHEHRKALNGNRSDPSSLLLKKAGVPRIR